jgi:hypothetical protein
MRAPAPCRGTKGGSILLPMVDSTGLQPVFDSYRPSVRAAASRWDYAVVDASRIAWAARRRACRPAGSSSSARTRSRRRFATRPDLPVFLRNESVARTLPGLSIGRRRIERRRSARTVDIAAMRDRDDRDRAGRVIDAIDDPIGSAARRQVPLQLETQRLTQASGVGCDRVERLHDCRGDRNGQAIDLATRGGRDQQGP